MRNLILAQVNGVGSETDKAFGEAVKSAAQGWEWWSALFQNSTTVVIGVVTLGTVAAFLAVLRWLVVRKLHSGFAALKEVFGRGDLSGLCWPGLIWLIPFRNTLKVIDLQVQLTPESASTQTSGGAMVHADVVVQWQVGVLRPDAISDEEYRAMLAPDILKAAYATGDLKQLVKTTASHALRAVIAQHSIEELASMREKLASDVMEQLATKLKRFGVTILDVSLSKVEPDAAVKEQMDSVTAAQFKQRAAQAYADAEKVKVVTAAQAEAEAQAAIGAGVAEKLVSIMAGYVAALRFATGKETIELDEAGAALVLFQHQNLEMLTAHATSGKANAVIHSAPQGGMADHINETAVAIMAADSTDVTNKGSDDPNQLQLPEDARGLLADGQAKIEDSAAALTRKAQTQAEAVRNKLNSSKGGRFLTRVAAKQLEKVAG